MRTRAFSLIELLVVVVIIALLIALLLPAIAKARRVARMAVCESNLKQMMIAHMSYGQDYANYVGALCGRAQDRSQTEIFAVGRHLAIQAQEIIVNATGRPAGRVPNGIPEFQGDAYNWVIEQYSHLAIAAYLGATMPSPVTVCPEDRARLSWRAAPLKMSTNPLQPIKGSLPNNKDNLAWWPFSASYQFCPWACAGRVQDLNHHGEYSQAENHDQYHIKSIISARRLDEVDYPAQKVALMDSQDRHVAKTELFYAFPTASQPLAFFDGSVSLRRSKDSNPGADEGLNHTVFLPSRFYYKPDPGFESPAPLGWVGRVPGLYRWTRNGLHGIDFGGAEIDPKKK